MVERPVVTRKVGGSRPSSRANKYNMTLKPINLYYDRIEDGIAKSNGLMPQFRHLGLVTSRKSRPNMNKMVVILRALEYLDIDYTILPIEDICNQKDDCNDVYVIEPYDIKTFIDNNIFEDVSDIAKEHYTKW